MKQLKILLLMPLLLLLAVPVTAEEEADEMEASPSAVVVLFSKKGDKDSDAVRSKLVAPLRTKNAKEAVLFLDLEVGNAQDLHQARLLLGGLGMSSVYSKYKSKVGTGIVWDAYAESVAGTFSAKTSAADVEKLVRRVLEGPPEEDMEEEDK